MSNRRRTRMGIIGGNGQGVGVQLPSVAGQPGPSRPDRLEPWTTRSPLTDTFPTFRMLRSSWGLLPPPVAGSTFTGFHAAFPLINIRGGEVDNQDVLLAAVHCVLGSPNVNAAQGFAGWGAIDGTGAAIVVGANIVGLKEATGLANSWSRVTLPVGWVDTALLPRPLEDTRLIFASPFAPGNFVGSASRVDVAEDYPPHVERFRQNDRIQAAFVVTAASANAAAAGQLTYRGLCELRLRLGLTFNLTGLEST